MCSQPGDKKEDCVRRNVLYESECVECGQGEDVTDNTLERKGKEASLYVGETARSLFERSQEHWQAAEQKKEESHMVQHAMETHKGERLPMFKFKVVRSFRSALDRQIGEAIRIEMRGNLLNRKGEFNRCSLTRLGVDQKWENERWEKSWENIVAQEDDATIYMLESEKVKRPEEDTSVKGAQRLKRESDGSVWGG